MSTQDDIDLLIVLNAIVIGLQIFFFTIKIKHHNETLQAQKRRKNKTPQQSLHSKGRNPSLNSNPELFKQNQNQ